MLAGLPTLARLVRFPMSGVTEFPALRFELMFPHQIRAAIAGNWPVVLPLGVLEYHGEHLAVGMDTLAAVKVLDILECETDLVILPPFYYGASSYAVAPPEGSIQTTLTQITSRLALVLLSRLIL